LLNANDIEVAAMKGLVVGIAKQFERGFGKPMVTANQASLLLILKKAQHGKPMPGFGALLRRL
jgi:maleate cis-trans isomerase